MSEKETSNYAFHEMSFTKLRALKRKLESEGTDTKALLKLKAFAQIKIQNYLQDVPEMDLIEPPELFAFLHTFAKEDGKLTSLGERALRKLRPALKAYDEENGLLDLKEIPEKKLLENLSLLDKFEKINPFEQTRKGLRFEMFQRGYQLLTAIKMTDDEGQPLDEKSQLSFRETMLETARLTTYTRLSSSSEKLTKEAYLEALCQTIEIDLITLLTADEMAKQLPLTEDTQQKITDFFEKFLNSLS